MAETRTRGIRASSKGIQLLQEAQRTFENGRMTYEKIASALNLDVKTVGRFFRGTRLERSNAIAIIKFFKLSIEDVIASEEILVDESVREIESKTNDNPERAQELIEKLQNALDELRREEDINHQAMEWLKAHRKGLAQEAVEATLKSSLGKQCFGTHPKDQQLEKFSEGIRKYLQLVYYSLEEGSWAVIDGAIKESLIPLDLEAELYKEALVFIKDQKVSQNLPTELAQSINVFLDYLIQVLPRRF